MSEDRTFSTKEAPAGYTDNSDIPTILPSPDDVGISGGNCTFDLMETARPQCEPKKGFQSENLLLFLLARAVSPNFPLLFSD